MNPICVLCQRNLSAQAVHPDKTTHSSWVVRHLRQCSPCQRAEREFHALVGSLKTAEPVKAIPDDFEQVVWHRLQSLSPTSRSNRSLTLGAGVAATIAVIAITIVTTNHLGPGDRFSPSPTTIRAPERLARGNEHSQMAPKIVSPTSESHARGATNRIVVRSKRPRIAQNTRKHAKKRMPVPGKTIRRVQQLASASTQNTAKPTARIIPSWEQWANYYESLGDYRSAERAYLRAAVQSGNPGLTFKAGQAAEQAGDVAQAVRYYSTLLKAQSEQQKQPEKGSRIWTQEQDSA